MTGFDTVVGMVNGMLKSLNITVPVSLHLDHGSFDGAKACIEAGFSSVMFDGSHYSIEENVQKTTEIIAYANERGISVEAEVGSIGGEEDGVIGAGEVADVNECKMIADLGVTMLAAGIGNIHGKYPANWTGLRLDVLKNIQDATGNMPLVLHGGTGIPSEMVREAISLGVSKINVNTELQLVFAAATRVYFEKEKSDHDYVIKLLPKEQTVGITKIYLSISKITFKIKKIITLNEYDDETVIELINSKFNLNLDKSLFSFIMPEGTDVIMMDE
jgi:fructose-bisphosphate aldolase class II